MNHSKASLRAGVRDVLASIPSGQLAAWSAAIRAHLAAYPPWASARTVMVFEPMRREVDLGPLIDAALAEGRTVALPACDWNTCRMTPVAITSRGADLVPGDRGLREPRPGLPEVDPAALDLVIVPGLAFDSQGRRLGRGKGFYDRLLAGLSPPTSIVAVAFDAQMVDEVPAEPLDKPVDAVITESGVRFSRR